MRYVTTTKKQNNSIDSKNTTVIILNAAYKNKIISANILSLDNVSLLANQVNLFRSINNNIEIICITGDKRDDVYKRNSSNIKYIENELWNESNELKSVSLALRATTNKSVIIMHGDMLYDFNTIQQLFKHSSSIVIDKDQQLKQHKIGSIYDDNILTNLAFNISTKWGQIAVFTGKELELLKDVAFNKAKQNWFLHEAINYIVEKNGIFSIINGNMREINTIKDIDNAKNCLSV